MKSVSILLLGAAILLASACSDEEKSHQNTMATVSTPTHSQLLIQDSGSTASGVVHSNRGGIACSLEARGSSTVKTGTCTGRIRTGTNVFLTAAPSIGSRVTHWKGCTPASDNPLSCQLRVTTNSTVSVTFEPTPSQFTLTIQGGAGGSGLVKSNPAGINCTITAGTAGTTGCSFSFPAGQSVLLRVWAAAGNYLKAWSGAGCDVSGSGKGSDGGTCTVTMSDTRAVVVSFENAAAQATSGAWSAPFAWPVVGIHASVLPNGKVLTFGRAGHNPALWDPATPTAFGSTTRPADFFCSGHVLLPDGRLFVAGGHAGADNFGIKTTYYYDFATNTWTRGNDMQNGRWYPTTTVLPNGEVLTISGGDTAGVMNTLPEVWQTDGTWRALTGAQINIAYYSMMFVMPDGRVFAAGPAQGTRFFTTAGTGTLTVGPTSHFGQRDYGSAVMYDAGKILIVGGNPVPTSTAEVIDLSSGTGTWRSIAPMSVGRRQLNATLLADGKVLVTGGTNSSGFNVAPTDSRVLAAELWDPATEQWTTLARMSHQRVYHSSALLLPDGRVLSVGSGEPPATGLTDDYTAEIFSPPYLFKADGTPANRPTISSVPVTVGYGQTFAVSTPNATSIAKITWIRLSSVTHSFNQNQRMNRLSFSASGTGTLNVTAPANSNLSPPGHYLLFLVNSAGVPSVGKIVRIG
jgi:hypothetical protein